VEGISQGATTKQVNDPTVLPAEVDSCDEAGPAGPQPAAANRPTFKGWLHEHLNAIAFGIVAAGFGVRLYVAGKTYLNPDEALHYLLINQPSLIQAYKASLTNAHPPLIYLVLYFWRFLGRSELMLRMPSVLAGTAFCWIAYKWMRIVANKSASLIAVTFLAFSPATVSLSAEVRAYALMLFCMAGALYFLGQAFEKKSVQKMWLFSGFLYLSILSHYSVMFFAVAVGLYVLARIADLQLPRNVALAWAFGQIGALALYGLLYLTHISKIKNGIAVWATGFNAAFFHFDDGNIFTFTRVNTLNIFLYLFAHRVAAWILFLCFVASVAYLFGKDLIAGHGKSLSNRLSILLVFPFIAVWGASLAGIYPYLGSRHTVFLAPFVIAGASYFLSAISGQRLWAGLTIAAALMILSQTADKPVEPNVSKVDGGPQVMAAAVTYMKETIPLGDHILVDFQSSLPITYYFCGPQQIVPVETFNGEYFDFACNGNPIVSLHTWKAGAVGFPMQFQKMALARGLKPGDRVWLYQTGWGDNLDTQLDRRDPKFQCLNPRNFGPGITVIPFVVGPDYFPTAAPQNCSH